MSGLRCKSRQVANDEELNLKGHVPAPLCCAEPRTCLPTFFQQVRYRNPLCQVSAGAQQSGSDRHHPSRSPVPAFAALGGFFPPKHALRVSAKKMNGSLTLISAALSSAVHFPPGPEGRSSACTLLGQRLVIESDLHLIVPVVLLWSRQGVDCRGVLYNQVVTVSRRVSAERHYAKKRQAGLHDEERKRNKTAVKLK